MWPAGVGDDVGEVVVVRDVVVVAGAVVVAGEVVVGAEVVVDGDVVVTTVLVPPELGAGCLFTNGFRVFVVPAIPVAAVKPAKSTTRAAVISKMGLGGELGGIRLPFFWVTLAVLSGTARRTL
jgi:hypothetical protein